MINQLINNTEIREIIVNLNKDAKEISYLTEIDTNRLKKFKIIIEYIKTLKDLESTYETTDREELSNEDKDVFENYIRIYHQKLQK
jgi:hypothetical protein